MKIDVFPVETAQARLEQIKAFLLLFINQYGHASDLKTLGDQDRELVEINLITLHDMIYDLHAYLGKTIDNAYSQK